MPRDVDGFNCLKQRRIKPQLRVSAIWSLHCSVTGMRSLRDSAGFSLPELIVVTAVIGIIVGMAVPMFGSIVGNLRLNNDARGVANAAAMAKMQAAANFSRSRLYADLTAKTYHIEIKASGGNWVSQGTTYTLSGNDSFGYASVSAPPPNTQTTIGQAALCLDNQVVPQTIEHTACIMFNSRGIPIDSTQAPTGASALYVTDGTAVIGLTASATGILKMWRTGATTTSWLAQ